MINLLNKEYRVEDVIKLRNETPVGSVIRFKKKLTEDGRYEIIFGAVVKKYEYIFILYNGEYAKCYTWVDYLLGKMKV